jgi:hypothetical protein
LQDASVPYSADVAITLGDGEPTRGRIESAPGMQRLEQRLPGGARRVMITRFDRQLAYLLEPATESYRELHLNLNVPTGWDDALLTLTPEGPDTVGGIPATRYAVAGDPRPGTHVQGQLWRTDDSIMVKADATTGAAGGKALRSLFELSNLQRGPQDPALFEPPAGYTKE